MIDHRPQSARYRARVPSQAARPRPASAPVNSFSSHVPQWRKRAQEYGTLQHLERNKLGCKATKPPKRCDSRARLNEARNLRPYRCGTCGTRLEFSGIRKQLSCATCSKPKVDSNNLWGLTVTPNPSCGNLPRKWKELSDCDVKQEYHQPSTRTESLTMPYNSSLLSSKCGRLYATGGVKAAVSLAARTYNGGWKGTYYPGPEGMNIGSYRPSLAGRSC